MTDSMLLRIAPAQFCMSVLNEVPASLLLSQRCTFGLKCLTALLLNLVALAVVFSISVARTRCSISVILVNDELLLRRVVYRRFDCRRRILSCRSAAAMSTGTAILLNCERLSLVQNSCQVLDIRTRQNSASYP